ncbi:MAG TPA: ABC transporter permease [Gemmatimonadaceae bacterium]|jgi:predicted permease|nr:ABC transporter permease [Gemmatimonadaceae bacterium]
MHALLQDLRYARRILVKSPLFTLAVVATLAIGIGLNTAVFSVIDTLLLKPLPGVRAPDQLVQLYRSWPGNQVYGSNSIPHFRDVRDQATDVFSGVAAWNFQQTSISSGGRAQTAFGAAVSGNYFNVLGVPALLGRTFTTDEMQGLGAHPVLVLSYNGWKELFGGDSGVVGRTVILDGRNYTIVGVTPPDFRGAMPIVTPSLFVPLTQINELDPGRGDLTQQRGSNSFNVIARLKPGVTVAQARDRMNTLVTGLRKIYPDDYKDNGITVIRQVDAGIHPMLRSAEVGLSSVVMAVVTILLLIACVNVANLFLARARDRAREMAVRLSLGARRGVLVRQLLVESSLFALVSGVAGLAVAWWTMSVVNHISLPMDVDFQPGLSLSPRVLMFTVGITLVTGLLFGLAPAIQATRPSLVPALKGEEAAGASRSRATRALVVAQVALSMILLVAAGLFLRNLAAATTVNKGFNATNMLVASVDPGIQGYNRTRTDEFYRQLTARLTANPDVVAVGYATTLPLSLNENDSGVQIPGYTPGKNENMSVQNAAVTPGFFAAMGIPVQSGRVFRAQDDSSAAPVIIINEQFAHRFWPGQDALGKTVHTHGRDWTVVGVVPTGKYFSLGEPPTAYYYVPQAQYWSFAMNIAIRTRGDPQAVIPVLRRTVNALDPNMPLASVRTIEDFMGMALLPARVTGWALGLFGVLGLLLASIGIYGVMAYSVSQRTREIGIRMAIGAGGGQVIRLLMRQGLRLVLVGLVVGLAGAVVAALAIRGQLYGGTGLDPVTFVVVPLVLVLVAMGAIWIPAKRAAALDPVRALRQD